MSDAVAKPGAPSLFANWRQYIPYLGFVLIFAFFSATLYNQGFLAKTYEYWKDERFISTMQLFVRQAIAANSGLSDSQVNIFLGERLDYARTQQKELQSSQSGRQGRGLF